MYTVFRRSDGYINAVNRTRPYTVDDLNQSVSHSPRMTFEILLVTEDWPTARTFIEQARAESPFHELHS